MILSPAGTTDAFLAALAAGADAVYCGLKQFSARMAAANFTMEELARLAELAHGRGTAVYVAVNNLVTPGELDSLARTVDQLARCVKPDALIFADPAVSMAARQAGFTGELHLSTLGNAGFPAALSAVKKRLSVDRVVLPRELSIDEIKAVADAAGSGPGLEVFVHGALCYGVSGRCYWSSFLGGKSGLRGRCVQPCRRRYEFDRTPGRLFSCRDFSLDVLVKTLLPIRQIRAWKIEGRKKGPHYVYYTTTAYKMLRDEGQDPAARKSAVELLELALSRPSTKYGFLSHRPYNPIGDDTGSGRLVGVVKGPVAKPFLSPREPLLAGDVLRVGFEDENWHTTVRVAKSVPKGARYNLPPKAGNPSGAQVFLIDRREPALSAKISELSDLLGKTADEPCPESTFTVKTGKPFRPDRRVTEITVHRVPSRTGRNAPGGYWASEELLESLPRSRWSGAWWWLPPVAWPSDEEKWVKLVERLVNAGAKRFVLNVPWQRGWFPRGKKPILWAGPFCNLANPASLSVARESGFTGAVVSPELSGEDLLALPGKSPLPLGVVLTARWPLCISRTLSEELPPEKPFLSPKKEVAFARRHGSDVWVYPNWRLDLSEKRDTLFEAGYRFFAHLPEPLAEGINEKPRPGLWNWDTPLL